MSIMEMNEVLRAVGEVKNECINIGWGISSIEELSTAIKDGVTAIGNAGVIKSGVVKSVQRGSIYIDLYVFDDDPEKAKSIKIPISPVNLSKSVLLLFGDNSDTNVNGSERTIALNADSIVFTLMSDTHTAYWRYEPLFWQVIEFY